jgi:hypothetical protein
VLPDLDCDRDSLKAVLARGGETVRIPIITAGIVLLVIGNAAYSGISNWWNPPPPRVVPPPKPREAVTFSATIVNVRKITRGSSTRAERYELILSGAPEGQGDLRVYPDKIAVTDEDMKAVIGQRATISCEKYEGDKGCFSADAIDAGGRRFAKTKS